MCKVRVPLEKRCWDPGPRFCRESQRQTHGVRHPATHRGTGKGISSVGPNRWAGWASRGLRKHTLELSGGGREELGKAGAGDYPPELQGGGIESSARRGFKEALVSARSRSSRTLAERGPPLVRFPRPPGGVIDLGSSLLSLACFPPLRVLEREGPTSGPPPPPPRLPPVHAPGTAEGRVWQGGGGVDGWKKDPLLHG